jgi:predicted transcriptional regulator YdeE
MEPKIIERGPTSLVGMDFYGDPFSGGKGWSRENEIGKLWQRFSSFWDAKQSQIEHVVDPNVGYEVHIEPEEYQETKHFYVMVGVEVSRIGVVPLELSFRVLPPTTYAVFTLRGKEITSNWQTRIFKEWLPDSGYEEAHRFLIEYYGPSFKGMDDPESELEVHVPIRRRT